MTPGGYIVAAVIEAVVVVGSVGLLLMVVLAVKRLYP